VLLVDDDEDDQVLTGDLVAQIRVPRRATLEWARSYETGLEALQRNASDICLLDYRLGARDGLELLREARSRGCLCPIIVLTGKGGDGTDTRAMNCGADDYLIKGDLSVASLERSIRYAIDRARHVDELRASEQRYRSIFETSSEGILMVDIETHAVRYANPAATRMSGYTDVRLHGERALRDVPRGPLGERRPGEQPARVREPGSRYEGPLDGPSMSPEGR
jgi:DNA-binding response OmpR family regulator